MAWYVISKLIKIKKPDPSKHRWRAKMLLFKIQGNNSPGLTHSLQQLHPRGHNGIKIFMKFDLNMCRKIVISNKFQVFKIFYKKVVQITEVFSQ